MVVGLFSVTTLASIWLACTKNLFRALISDVTKLSWEFLTNDLSPVTWSNQTMEYMSLSKGAVMLWRCRRVVSLQDPGEVIRFLGNQTVETLFIVKTWDTLGRWVSSRCRRVVSLQDPREVIRFFGYQTVETLFMVKAWEALGSWVSSRCKRVIILQDPIEAFRFLGNQTETPCS